MKKWDLIIVIVALLVAGGLYFSGMLRADTPGGVATIYVNAEEVKKLSLLKTETYTVETEHGYNIIEIKDGKARVIDADCRDKICVNHTPVSLVNESITCLPHKMVIEIQGAEKSEVDTIAQ